MKIGVVNENQCSKYVFQHLVAVNAKGHAICALFCPTRGQKVECV